MYIPAKNRYEKMKYRRCGNSGLKLPVLSFGLWQNFSHTDNIINMEEMCHTAFDNGITYFDLANNYGHPYNGSAEENFGIILDRGMRAYRDELIISTKAGYDMWDGPYGSPSGTMKYLTSSLDQSLKRMKLDYVDIFYHHVFDPETPLEETAFALDNAVRQGKALYVGISNYDKENTKKITAMFKEMKTPFIVNQPPYSMLNRWIEEDGLKEYCHKNGTGLAVFSPLFQGILSGKYLNGIAPDTRAGKKTTGVENQLTDNILSAVKQFNVIAEERGQKLSQLALSWILKDEDITTVITGASRPAQILENLEAINKTDFSKEELDRINNIFKSL